MGNYVLSESSIFAKQRYVFSDSTDTALRNASISFELGLTPMNYENVTLKAHIILATSQQLQEIESELNSGSSINELVMKQFEYYKELTINGSTPFYFNDTHQVDVAGVYYTLFIYERSEESSRRSLRVHDHLEDTAYIIKERSFIKDPIQNEFAKEQHLVVTGNIVYKNSYGFLSGDIA